MIWPCLVKEWACNVQAVITLTGDLTEQGAPQEYEPITVMCNYSERQKQVMDDERRLVMSMGVVLIPGDIAPDLPKLKGTVEVNGSAWNILIGSRGRNPDGTVNFTALELT